MHYSYIFATVLLTVYCQMVVKWQVSLAGTFPEGPAGKARFLVRLLFNPWVISGFTAALLAAISWMAAMTKFELSYAYPLTSLSFPLVLVISALLFQEPLTPFRIGGVVLIVFGIVVASRG